VCSACVYVCAVLLLSLPSPPLRPRLGSQALPAGEKFLRFLVCPRQSSSTEWMCSDRRGSVQSERYGRVYLQARSPLHHHQWCCEQLAAKRWYSAERWKILQYPHAISSNPTRSETYSNSALSIGGPSTSCLPSRHLRYILCEQRSCELHPARSARNFGSSYIFEVDSSRVLKYSDSNRSSQTGIGTGGLE
jgi:hypothetical protein